MTIAPPASSEVTQQAAMDTTESSVQHLSIVELNTAEGDESDDSDSSSGGVSILRYRSDSESTSGEANESDSEFDDEQYDSDGFGDEAMGFGEQGLKRDNFINPHPRTSSSVPNTSEITFKQPSNPPTFGLIISERDNERWSGVSFVNCLFDEYSKTVFDKCLLKGVTFKDCKFVETKFIEIMIERTTFDGCTFKGGECREWGLPPGLDIVGSTYGHDDPDKDFTGWQGINADYYDYVLAKEKERQEDEAEGLVQFAPGKHRPIEGRSLDMTGWRIQNSSI